ncbi:class I SAM-dependent methyltransferase [Clostridium sp. KNHs205]|uniref:class I SAM-dependent methyltransferase n=1 Tax=Clostridium sp. KNHs205 TaxID=1449050 RepID=UPI00051CA60A|nr:class I SAM-dependent methyltransferase [Clostridium sp. KNHs205]
MDFRTIFEQVPEQFDKWRPRYCDELFTDLIEYANLDSNSEVLEVGPGTGQATEPILKTGCSYKGIELGESFSEIMKDKYNSYKNFNIINADFETYPFESEQFDLVYSAAAFQWIPERIGYPKAFDILKGGGAFAMFMMRPDIRPGGGYTDEPLFSQIQEVYAKYFRPETEYKCSLDYDARDQYGFVNLERREYLKTREYNADDYVSLIGTHCDHITLKEPDKKYFYEGIRKVILDAGDKITLYDKITMYLAKKP